MASFFPFLLPNLKESSPVTSTFQVLPSPLRPRRLLFGLWLTMFNSLLSCLLLCSQYCGTYKKKNHQVLVEWILIALPASHFNPTAVEVYESNLFVFIFRFWAYLSIHINVTSCQEATNTTSKGSWFHAFFTSVSLPLWCSVWARPGSHLLWLMSLGRFQNLAQRWHFWRSHTFKHLRTICVSGASALLAITAWLLPSTFSQSSSYKRLAHSSLWVKGWNEKHSLPMSI